MIIELLFNLIFGLINFILDLLPSVPNFDPALLNDFNYVLDLIFENAKLLGFFFPVNTIKVYLPLVLIVINFEHIYNLAMWVVTWIKSHK